MAVNYIDRSRDEEIIGIVRSILSSGVWNVETIHEAVLLKLMELRGTPIKSNKILRDIDRDYELWVSDSIVDKKPEKVLGGN